MEPKEKAKELVNKMLSINLAQDNDLVDGQRIYFAKQCALICVDEKRSTINKIESDIDNGGSIVLSLELDYLDEVKQEIEKL